MSDVSQNKNAAPEKPQKHRHRSRSRSNNPRNLRSTLMRHVVGFAVLFIYLAFVGFKADAEDGTLSNLTVIFFLVKCAIAYAVGYFLYTPVHRAWQDSKR